MECTNCSKRGILCTGIPPQMCPQCAVAGEHGVHLDGPCVYGGIVQPAQAGPGVGIAVASRSPVNSGGNNLSNNNENLENSLLLSFILIIYA